MCQHDVTPASRECRLIVMATDRMERNDARRMPQTDPWSVIPEHLELQLTSVTAVKKLIAVLLYLCSRTKIREFGVKRGTYTPTYLLHPPSSFPVGAQLGTRQSAADRRCQPDSFHPVLLIFGAGE
jgi:hypothetical protein